MANKIGIVLALDGEKEFTAAVQTAQKEVKMFQSELKGLSDKFDGQANSMAALTEKQRVLTQQQEAYQRKLDAAKAGCEKANQNYTKMGERLTALKKDLEQARKELQKMDDAGEKGTDAYKNQAKSVEELEKAIEKQTVAHTREAGSIAQWNQRVNESQRALDKQNDELKQNEKYLDEARNAADHCATSIDKMGNEVKNAADDLDEAGKKTSTFGDVLKANLTADAIVGGVKKVGEAAKEAAKYVVGVGSSFEAAMSEVAAISGASGDDLDALSEKAKELGASTKFTATEAAEAFKYMSLAGWETADMLDGIDGILNLAAASGMELAQASDMVTDYLSAFGMEASESIKIADMLAFAQANSNTTAEQLGEAYGNCAANMHAAGQDIETTTSFLEAFANQGIKGSEAGTKMSAIMRDITAKMKDGKIAIGDTNVEVTDANGNFRDLTDIMTDVETATQGMGDAERAAALSATFTSRSVGGLNMILNEGVGQISNYEESLRSAGGAADEAATIMQDNLSGDLTTMNSALEGLGIAAYEYVDGPLRGVVQGVTGVINGITDAITPQKTELEQFIDDIKSSNDEVNTLLENAQTTLSGAEADVGTLEAYKTTLLELNEAESLTEFQKYQLANAVNTLSDSVPGLAEAFDAETSSLNLTNEQLTQMFENAEALAMQNALIKAQADSYDALAQATINKAKADSAVKAAQDDLNAVTEEYQKRIEETGTDQNEYYGTFLDAQVTLDNAVKAQEKVNETHQKAREQIETEEEALKDLKKEYGLLPDATDDAATGIKNTTTAVTEASTAAKAGADAQKEALQSVRDEFDALKDDIQQTTDSKISLFDAFNGGDEVSLEDMQTNMQSYADGIRQYYDDLETLSKDVGSGISQEFFQYLSDLGPEGANVIHEITEAWTSGSEEERRKVQEIMYQFLQSLDASEQGAEIQARNQMLINEAFHVDPPDPSQYDGLYDSLKAAIESGGAEVVESTRSAFEGAVEAARQVGADIPSGIEEMISNGDIEGAIAALGGSVQGKLEGLAQMAREAGLEVSPEIAAGIEAGGQEAIAAYSTLMENIASQIEAGKGDVEEAANTAVSGAAEADAPSMDGTGAEITQNIADDITANKGVISDAVTRAVAEGANAATEQAGLYVSAGESLGEAVAQGLSSKQEEINEALTGDTGALSDNADAYEQAGEALGDAVVAGLESKQDDINEALSPDAGGLTEKSGDYEAAGAGLGSAFAGGMAQANKEAQASGTGLGEAAINGARTQIEAMRVVAQQTAQRYVDALNAAKSQSAQAGGSLASSARNAVASWSGSFYSIGVNMSAGVASGINAGASSAINAAANMARQALASAKAALDIHSPSKRFREEVGQNISASTAFSINDKASLAGKAASKMSAQVYSKAAAWISKYKSAQQVSLEDEKYYWQQVLAHTKAGTAAYNNIAKKIQSISFTELTQSGITGDVAAKISGNFGVSKKTGSGKKKKTKDAETYYSEIYSAASKYISNQQVLNDWSLQQELAYWNAVRGQLKSGTQAWYDATKQINELNEQAAEAEAQAAEDRLKAHVNVQNDILDKYKVYYKVSAKAEADYWNIARQQFAAGTDERIEADQKYFDARQEYYDQLAELDEDYAEKKKDIDKELADSIEDLQEAYDDAVKSRKQEILSSFNLFEAWDAEGYNSDKLMANLKTQVEGMRFWEQQLQELGRRGVSDALMEELASMGPDAAANLWSLNQMTAEQLEEYNRLWEEKNDLAHKQALEDNENLLKETQDAIADARKKAQDEMSKIEAEYRDAVSELNTGLSDGLRSLVEQAGNIGEEMVSALIEKIRGGASSVPGEIAKLTGGSAPAASTQQAAASAAPAAAPAASAPAAAPAKKTDEILEIINSGKARSKTLTAAEKKDHAELWKYIVKKYGRTPGNAMYTALGDALGVKTSKSVTGNQKDKILEKLKKKGYASGTRAVLEDELAWLLENKKTEYLVRSSDQAILQPMRAGDKVINPKGAENVYDFANDPGAFLQPYMTAALMSAEEEMQRQQVALQQQMAALDSSGIARLNHLMDQGGQQVTVNVDTGGVLSMMGTLASALNRLVELAEGGRQAVPGRDEIISTLVDALQQPMSRENAIVQRRRNRGAR